MTTQTFYDLTEEGFVESAPQNNYDHIFTSSKFTAEEVNAIKNYVPRINAEVTLGSLTLTNTTMKQPAPQPEVLQFFDIEHFADIKWVAYVEGKFYYSCQEVEKAFDVRGQTVQLRLTSEKYPNWLRIKGKKK